MLGGGGNSLVCHPVGDDGEDGDAEGDAELGDGLVDGACEGLGFGGEDVGDD